MECQADMPCKAMVDVIISDGGHVLNILFRDYHMSTVVLPGISARKLHICTRAFRPEGKYGMPGRYAWKRDGGHVLNFLSHVFFYIYTTFLRLLKYCTQFKSKFRIQIQSITLA